MFFQPDPYVKLRILPGESQTLLPHHGQEARSAVAENTVNPTWKRQVRRKPEGDRARGGPASLLPRSGSREPGKGLCICLSIISLGSLAAFGSVYD